MNIESAKTDAAVTGKSAKAARSSAHPGASQPPAPVSPERNWLQSLEDVVEFLLKNQGREKASQLLASLGARLRADGVDVPVPVSTPYINTIPVEKEPPYPGNREIERRIKSLARWNAMAMVVNANHGDSGVGGHISSYASMATLYEVAYNHFFRGGDDGRLADMVYFQGHATPGNYARAFLECRLDEGHLHNFRKELAEGGGLSSYPHPYLMPDFWQFPTVSMGLGPIMSIYQARFIRYLQRARLAQSRTRSRGSGLSSATAKRDEPETLGAITLAARENLDNLDLGRQLQFAAPRRPGARQRQNHPGTGRRLPRRGLERHQGHLGLRLGRTSCRATNPACCSSAWEKPWTAISRNTPSKPGSYIRKHFFGKYPELLATGRII